MPSGNRVPGATAEVTAVGQFWAAVTSVTRHADDTPNGPKFVEFEGGNLLRIAVAED